jgi:hypothetical protein
METARRMDSLEFIGSETARNYECKENTNVRKIKARCPPKPSGTRAFDIFQNKPIDQPVRLIRQAIKMSTASCGKEDSQVGYSPIQLHAGSSGRLCADKLPAT